MDEIGQTLIRPYDGISQPTTMAQTPAHPDSISITRNIKGRGALGSAGSFLRISGTACV
ncbi:MAG: hypothetical protein ACJAYF_002910 [Arenicella sp.]|jgi:hypothetical protein